MHSSSCMDSGSVLALSQMEPSPSLSLNLPQSSSFSLFSHDCHSFLMSISHLLAAPSPRAVGLHSFLRAVSDLLPSSLVLTPMPLCNAVNPLNCCLLSLMRQQSFLNPALQ